MEFFRPELNYFCAVCRFPVLGESRYQDADGQVCHTFCRNQTALCAHCGRFVVGEGVSDKDDFRLACELCRPITARERKALKPLIASARSFLVQQGLDVPDRIKAMLASDGTLWIRARRWMIPDGLASYDAERRACEVLVKAGLDPLRTSAVLVHEFVHCWQFTTGIGHARDLQEGSAEYFSYRFLETAGPAASGSLRAFELNGDPAYGGGFRLSRRLAEDSCASPDGKEAVGRQARALDTCEARSIARCQARALQDVLSRHVDFPAP